MVLLGRRLPEAPPRRRERSSVAVSWLTTTDHKLIGYLWVPHGVPDPALAGGRGDVPHYADHPGKFAGLNPVSSIGAAILGASTLFFLYNVYWTARRAPRSKVDDRGFGNSLERATSYPPPRHNFKAIPRIRSERPAFDLHYPLRSLED
jgi:hypothetical protein